MEIVEAAGGGLKLDSLKRMIKENDGKNRIMKNRQTFSPVQSVAIELIFQNQKGKY